MFVSGSLVWEDTPALAHVFALAGDDERDAVSASRLAP